MAIIMLWFGMGVAGRRAAVLGRLQHPGRDPAAGDDEPDEARAGCGGCLYGARKEQLSEGGRCAEEALEQEEGQQELGTSVVGPF